MTTTYCNRHKPPMPFKPCVMVDHLDEFSKPSSKGKYTVSRCSLKKSHPKHTHCSHKSCASVSNLKHPAYKKEWQRSRE